MPRLTLEISHSLGLEEAARRLKEKFAAAMIEHRGRVNNLKHQWLDHTFSFSFQALGMAISGTVAVEPENVRLRAELPLAAMLFKRSIEDRLRHEVSTLLAPA